MKTIENYFYSWIHWVWNYNDMYEKPLKNYPLKDDPEYSIEILESYCKLIITEGKRRKKYNKENSFELFSQPIQITIQEIINLLSDGRDLHATIDVNNPNLPIKKFDHHLDINGKLQFENNPFDICKRIQDDIPKVKKIIQSDKDTKIFSQFYDHKWHYFDGCEDGSVVVKFNKINKESTGRFTFDGDMISFATIDSNFNGNGIIVNNDIENYPFYELPYYDETRNANELLDYIKQCEVFTDQEMQEKINEYMKLILEDIL